MRFGCILVHHLPVQVERLGRTWDNPLIIGGFPFERKPVYDASIEAIECGVRLGMPLSEAHILCPEAEFLPLNERKYYEIYEQIVQFLEGFSPSVETVELGCAFFDITGFEGESRLANQIVSCLSHHTGFRACLGIASNKFLSRIAAYVTKPEVPIIVPQGKETSFLAPFSVSLLPCSDETKKKLNLLGIRIISQLWSFTREELVEQFQEDGTIIYELAHGIDRTPLMPKSKPNLMSSRIQFDAPINSYLELLNVIDKVLDGFLAEFRKQGQVCSKIKLSVSFPTNSAEATLSLKEATNSHRTIMARVNSWLERARFSEIIDSIDISLEAEADCGKQLDLLKEKPSPKRKLASLYGLRLKKATVADQDALTPERSFRLTEVQRIQ